MTDIEKAYQESLDYLYSFIDFSMKRNLRNAEKNFKIERMQAFMHLLGDPQFDYKVIHVAGTKGKGSVSAFCASAIQAAGFKVGLYTSPHMIEFTERIRINGEMITRDAVVSIVDKLKKVVAQIPEVTTFELTTALGFLYFSEQHVDIAVIEVGLGGRLDATNVVDPLISVITAISYDHTQILGDTLSKIAFEKGGIIKQGKPVVISPQKQEVIKRLKAICKERSSPMTIVGKDVLFGAESHSLDGQTFFVWTPDEQSQVNEFVNSGGNVEWTPLRFRIPLLGHHQVINAATAYAVLSKLKQLGIKISNAAISKGFSTTSWPGRFEIMRRQPPFVVDSAHNQDSALKLRQAIDDYFPGKPLVLLFGVSSDKDYAGILEELLPRSRQVIATQSIHLRALDAGEICKKVLTYGTPCEAIIPIEKALKKAFEVAGDECLIVAAGSVFIAAAIKDIWAGIIK
jgi:dihydrofolate synthase/folylpolyglutamate synthase